MNRLLTLMACACLLFACPASIRGDKIPSREALLRQSLDKNPADAELHIQLGRICAEDLRYTDAIREYNEAERLGKNNYALHFFRGQAHFGSEDDENACADFTRALSLVPGEYEATAWLNLAKAKIAMRAEKNSLASRFAYASALFDLGWAWHAKTECEALLKSSPEDRNTRSLLDAARRAAESEDLVSRANTLLKKNKYKEALPLFEKAALLAESSGNKFLLSHALGNSAMACLETEQLKKALDLSKRALSLGRSLRFSRGTASDLLNRGQIFLKMGDYSASLRDCKEALEIIKLAGDRGHESAALNNTGQVFLEKGDLQNASDFFKRSASAYRQIRDLRGEAVATGNIGAALAARGDYTEAVQLLQEALHLYQDSGTWRGEADVCENLGLISMEQGQYEQGLEWLGRSLAVSQRAGYRTGESRYYLAAALLYEDMGNLERSRQLLDKALKIQKEIEDINGSINSLGRMGRYFLKIGSPGEAKSRFDAALALAEKLDSPSRKAACRLDLAMYHLNERNLSAAKKLANDSLGLYESSGLKADAARARILLVKIHLGNRDTETAASEITRVRALEKTLNRKPVLAELDYLEGETNRLAGRPEPAKNLLARALKKGTESGLSDLAWTIHRSLGLIEEEAGNIAGALSHYTLSIETLKGLRANAGSPGEKGFMRDRLDVYERAIALLIKLNRRQEAMGLLNESKAYLADASGNLVPSRGMKPEDREAYQRWTASRKRMESLELRLSRAGDAKSAEKLRNAVADQKKESLRLLLELKVNARFDRLTYGTPKAINENRKKLPERTAVVEYALSDSGSYAVLLTAADFEVIRLPRLKTEIREQVLRFLEKIKKKEDCSAEGAWLYQALMDPVRTQIAGADVLVFVAHDILNYLPFEALCRRENGRLTYLAQEKITAYLPDGSLEPLSSKPDRFSSKDLFIGYANTTFDSKPLPGAEEEVEMIQKILEDKYPGKIKNVRAREKGTKADFWKEAGRYSILHIATHARIGKTDEYSCLDFYRDTLTFREIFIDYPETANTRLAVLSACETASSSNLAEPTGGEALSLANVFLQRIPTVVASLWEVNDDSTRALMVHFYRRLVKDGMPAGASLREARLSLLKGKRYAHPYYWAPFLLFGDWR